MTPANPTEVRDHCLQTLGYSLDICDTSRRGKNSRQRLGLWWLMRQTKMLTGDVCSYPQIAAVTGAKSHSTVIQACKKFERLMNEGGAKV